MLNTYSAQLFNSTDLHIPTATHPKYFLPPTGTRPEQAHRHLPPARSIPSPSTRAAGREAALLLAPLRLVYLFPSTHGRELALLHFPSRRHALSTSRRRGRPHLPSRRHPNYQFANLNPHSTPVHLNPSSSRPRPRRRHKSARAVHLPSSVISLASTLWSHAATRRPINAASRRPCTH